MWLVQIAVYPEVGQNHLEALRFQGLVLNLGRILLKW